MSTQEILKIVIPLLVVVMLATLLVSIVRARSASRERALSELAARAGLKYTPAGKDFFQGSWPGKVGGNYRGRRLLLHYHDDPTMTRQGYNRASYSLVVEIDIQNPKQGSLMLQARPVTLLAGKPPAGDLFDQRITVSSKPNSFAAGLLIDPGLRKRLADTLTRDWMNPAKINVVRTGSLVFVRDGIHRSSDEFAALLDLLSDLADVIAGPEKLENI